MPRKLIAEWIGTFSLLATVVSSGIMAESLRVEMSPSPCGEIPFRWGQSWSCRSCLATFFFKWLLEE